LRVPKYRPPSHYRKEQEKVEAARHAATTTQRLKQQKQKMKQATNLRFGVSGHTRFRVTGTGASATESVVDDGASSIGTARSAGAASERSSEGSTAEAAAATPLYQIAKLSPKYSHHQLQNGFAFLCPLIAACCGGAVYVQCKFVEQQTIESVAHYLRPVPRCVVPCAACFLCLNTN
jgi:hypothetical protein